MGALQMKDSSFGFVSSREDDRLATGHFEAGWPAPPLPTHLRPAMQFTTTAADVGKFARFLMGNGSAGGRLLVRPELLRAMGMPETTDARSAGLRAG